MNEMELRKKMLQELMGQMDDRQMSNLDPSSVMREGEMGARPDPNSVVREGELDNQANQSEEMMSFIGGEEDELARKLRQASMQR